jgi:hypothetical protein
MHTVIISRPKIVLTTQEGVNVEWLRPYPGGCGRRNMWGQGTYDTVQQLRLKAPAGPSRTVHRASGLRSLAPLCDCAQEPQTLIPTGRRRPPGVHLRMPYPVCPTQQPVALSDMEMHQAPKQERFNESLLWLLRNRRQEQSRVQTAERAVLSGLRLQAPNC